MKKITLLSIVSILLLGACTLEKRIYRNGYNVQWHASLKSQLKAPKDAQLAHEVQVDKDPSIRVEKKVKDAFNSPTPTKNQELVEGTRLAITTAESELIKNEVEVNTPSNLNVSAISPSKVQNPVFSHFVKTQSSKASHISAKQSHQMKQLHKNLKALNQSSNNEFPMILIFILCFVLPPLAVGLVTNWDTTIIINNLLWCLLCGFPGMIHAILVVGRYS
ncbi:MAG: Proteolipid rane potential modulator [Bacteroidota bacterium]|jgi:uncharacterized membrane protein YqaE (UPF0057 family)